MRTLEALRSACPKLSDGYAACGASCWPETRDALTTRVRRTLGAVLDAMDGTLLVVSHAAPVAVAALLDTKVERVHCPLCALFCLEGDERGWRLVLDADVGHVGASLAGFSFP